MILYLDSSAAVKLCVQEDFSREVRRAVHRAERCATSLLSWVESRAAFARRLRSGTITQREFEQAVLKLERDWAEFEGIPADMSLIQRSAELAERFSLRAYDAVQLAAADHVRRAVRGQISFACFDQALNRAAVRIGLHPLSFKP